MSDVNNEKWLEAAQDGFEDAIAQGNLPLVKDIIADVLDVNPEAGRAMSERVKNLPVDTWNVISPIQESDL